MIDPADLEAARALIDYINASPTPYHAVARGAAQLEAAGFQRLDERDVWQFEPGDARYIVRGGGTLAAFRCGQAAPERAGFVLLGAHTDSPNFRVKPSPDIERSGYRQLGVEVYGGVLQSTWLDRDLSLAGRVSLTQGRTALIDFERVLCRMPNLAIHLDRTVNTDGLKLNAQDHLIPVLGLSELGERGLLSMVADQVSETSGAPCTPEEIVGFDLCLYDTQAGTLAGRHSEFINSARLDNLASCHSALLALCAGKPDTSVTQVVVLYDHEEVGSQSSAGAKSKFLSSVLERIAEAHPRATSQAAPRAFARSLLVSADMAHAVHPNYVDKHDKNHQPLIGHGPVIKINVNQSYATDGPSQAVFEEACRSAGFSAQRFVSRNDSPCGSTIGPISAALTGIRTVDVGNPMLSMHSCRETAGTADVRKMTEVMTQLLSLEQLPNPAS